MDPTKPSLREIAERASRGSSGPARPLASAARSRTPAPVRDNEDTGYVEVSELRNLMLASGRPIRAKTEDDEATRLYVPPTPLAYSRSDPPRNVERRALGRRAAGAAFGAAIALAGIAGAAAWVVHARGTSRATAPQSAVTEAPREAIAEAAPAAAAPAAGTAAPPKPGETSLETLPDTAAAAAATEPSSAPKPEARGAAPTAASPARPGAAPATPIKPGKPGDLASAIAAAAGDAKPAPAPDPASAPEAPAANAPSGLPAQPAQAAVRGALNAVKGAAKACVAEADGPSRALVVFAPSGSVSSVAVSGWATGKAAGCIKSAFKPAHVDAFSGPPFSVGVTINP